MSYALQGRNFTRVFPSAELDTLGLKLIGSPLSYFKTDGIVVILLSEVGYLLLMQVDGSAPGRTLFENYTFHYDSSYEHSVRLTNTRVLVRETLHRSGSRCDVAALCFSMIF